MDFVFLFCFLAVIALCVLLYRWGYKDGRTPNGLPESKLVPPPPQQKWTAVINNILLYDDLQTSSHFHNPLFSNVWHFRDCTQCQLCDRNVTNNDHDCEHIKNGYCQLFLNQAAQDIKEVKNQSNSSVERFKTGFSSLSK